MGKGPPKPDHLQFFRAIKYDIRNNSHRLAMGVPHFSSFTAEKLEFRPIPIFSCAMAYAFRVGWAPELGSPKKISGHQIRPKEP